MTLMVTCNFVVVALILIACDAQNCVFKDAGGSGQQLDLQALAFAKLERADKETPPNNYEFTPCRNALECRPDTGMAIKLNTIPQETCFVMANWNNIGQSTLPYYDNILQEWTFNYSTGNQCGGKPYGFIAYFKCDQGVGDYYVVSAETIRNCSSRMVISSKWACPGEVYTTPIPIDDSLSGGTIFCIILIILLSTYFIIGWICMAIINRKDYAICHVANIPHFIFWIKLPHLIIAGCSFSKDFIVALFCGHDTLNKSDKSDKSDALVVNNDNNPTDF